MKRSGKQTRQQRRISGNDQLRCRVETQPQQKGSRRQRAKRATDLEIPGESFEPKEVRVTEAKQGDVGKRHQNDPKRAGRKSKEQKRGEKEI